MNPAALEPQDLAALARLLEQALDLPAAERAAWLAALHTASPAQHAALQKLLASHEEAEAEDFLNRTLTVELLAQGHEAPGVQQLGPYRLLRKLGDGGMSSVWLAERADGHFEGQVAIKLLPPALASHAGFRERLQHEAQVLAKLSHPHIAKLLDAGIGEGGTPYLVLELVQGQSITSHCDERKLNVQSRLRLMLQVCEAVGYLHGNLVIHRDIKPSNVMVDEAGSVKLVDFGIAKLIGDIDDLTHAYGGAFTPDYAAPEQIRGSTLTTAADVYSLGAVLYRLLTGVKPQGDSNTHSRPSAVFSVSSSVPPEQREQIARARDSSVQRLQRQMCDELDLVTLKALAIEPEERYPTAVSLATELRAYMNGLPVAVKAPTWGYAMRKFATRHRAGVTVGLLALLCIVGLSGVSVWQAQRAQTSARQSERAMTFTQELLRSLDPNRNERHSDVSATLKAAVNRAQTDLAEEPQVLDVVLRVLDEVVENRTEDRALVVVRQARVDLARRLHGQDAQPFLAATIKLGIGQCQTYQHPQAIDTLSRALPRWRDAVGPHDELYLLGKIHLARAYKQSRQYPSGLPIAQEVEAALDDTAPLSPGLRAELAFELLSFYRGWDVRRVRFWLQHVQTRRLVEQAQSPGERLQRQSAIAGALLFTGQPLAGDSQMTQVLQGAVHHYGDVSTEHARTLREMADFDMLFGRFGAARQRLQRAWELRSESNDATAALFDMQRLANRGWVEFLADDMPAARGFMQQALAAVAQGKRESVRFHLLVLVAALRERDFETAERALADVRRLGAEMGGDQADITLLLARAHNSNMLRLKGHAQQALQMLQPVLERWRALYGESSYRGAQASLYEAMSLLDSGAAQAAAQAALKAQETADAVVGADHPLAAQARFTRAAALRRMGDRATADALIQQAQAVFASKLGQPLDERLMRVLY